MTRTPSTPGELVRGKAMDERRWKLGDVEMSCRVSVDFASAQWRYLEQYLCGFPAADRAAVRFVVCVDDERFASIAGGLRDTQPDAVIEPLRGVSYQQFRRKSVDWYRLWADSVEGDTFDYLVASDTDHVWLFMHSGTYWPERHLLRLMREAMVRRHEDRGWLVFHGAAVRLKGGAVLVCGPDGAGKTTFATALLQLPDAALLSNDTVLVRARDAAVLAVPQAVRAGAGLILATPALRDYVRSTTLTRLRQPAAGLVGGETMVFGSKAKFEFAPLEYTRALGAALASSAPLRMTLLPMIEPGPAPWRDDDREASQRLAGCCLTPFDPRRSSWIVPRKAVAADLTHQRAVGLREIEKRPLMAGRAGIESDMTGVVDRLSAIANH